MYGLDGARLGKNNSVNWFLRICQPFSRAKEGLKSLAYYTDPLFAFPVNGPVERV